MASGTLVTRVFTGRAELPIAGASVSVVKKDGDRLLDLLTVRVSGRGGDTEAYVIEAPEAEKDAVAALLKDCMEHVIDLSVPLVAEVKMGNSWYETK